MDGNLAISTDGYGDAILSDDSSGPTEGIVAEAAPAEPTPADGAPSEPAGSAEAEAEAIPAIVFAPVTGSVDAEASAPASDVEAEPAVDLARLESLLESLLLAAGTPVPLPRLVEVLDGPARRDVVAALKNLGERYEGEGRGLRLVHVAGGWQLRSAPEHGPLVRKLLGGRPPRLSRAMLETLAIVAYRQPCTKPEIEAIRGVDADATLNTLLERRMVKITGRKEAPGRPLLYATTREFLEVFGLPDLHALPPLAELGTGAELLAAPDLTIGPDGVQATPTPAAALGFTNGDAAAPVPAIDAAPADAPAGAAPPEGASPDEGVAAAPGDEAVG